LSSVLLSNVPSNARIILNNSGNKKYHRVIIDEISFERDYTEEIVLLKTLFTAGNPMTVRGLSPNADYLVTVTAFDAEGNESSPSEPLAVTTNGEAIPFSIRIQ
jgi:hypothetical protein